MVKVRSLNAWIGIGVSARMWRENISEFENDANLVGPRALFQEIVALA